MANRLNVANIGYNDATDALTIDSSGNVTAAGTLSAGTISEAVADAGVTIDGVVAKDSKVFAPSGIVFASAEITGDDAGTTNRVESSNLLDDYEEGTWTPTFEGSVSNPTIPNYANQDARYTKIGNVVTVNGRIRVGTLSSNGSGNCLIAGLPFATSGITGLQNAGCVGTSFGWATTVYGAPNGISADTDDTKMLLRVYKNDAGKIAGWSVCDISDLQSDSAVDFQMTYRV